MTAPARTLVLRPSDVAQASNGKWILAIGKSLPGCKVRPRMFRLMGCSDPPDLRIVWEPSLVVRDQATGWNGRKLLPKSQHASLDG